MFEDQTKAAILQRLLDMAAPDIDKRTGSIAFDMLSPAAIELALAYIELDNVINLGFIDTAYGEYIDRRAAERGLTRKPAVKAVGFVTFSGANGTVIPVGTVITTAGGIGFVTTAVATVSGGSATVAVEASEGGAAGNVGVAEITLVTGDLSGVISVTNAEAFTGGSDEETDEALMQRYLENVRTPATSGNAAHYRQWAKEVAGVYDARVFPLWNGPGTVKVSLLADNKRAPSQAVVDAAAAYIATLQPICTDVSVVGVDEVAINISVKLTLKTGGDLAAATEQIRDNVTAYLAGLAFNDFVVRYAKIAEAILNAPDVLDYENLTVNNGTGNVQIGEDEVAVTGAVITTL